MKTRDEILKELESNFDYKITKRTFDFYRDNKIIYPIQGRKNRQGLYPDDTVELIAFVQEQKENGMSLIDARKLYDTLRQKQVAETERLAAQRKLEFVDDWKDPDVRKQRLCNFLKLDSEALKIDVGMIGTPPDGKPESYLAAFENNYIDFYRVQVDYDRSDNWKLLDKKRLTNDGYDLVVRMLSIDYRQRGRVIDKDDIFLQIFFG